MGCSSSKTTTQPATQDTKSKTLMAPETQVKAATAKAATVNPVAEVSVDVAKLLNDVFDQLDVNGDGFISRSELSASLNHVLECSHLESRKSFRTLFAESRLNPYLSTFEQLDTNHDGKISREEFQASMHPSKAVKNIEQMLKDVFDSIDTNKDGSLSRDEVSRTFEKLLKRSCVESEKNIKTLMVDAGLNPDFAFHDLDANHDGRVTWEEFRAKLLPAFDSKEFLRSVFNQMDADGDGAISKQELTASFERMLDCSHMKSKKNFRTLLQEAGLQPEFYIFEQLDTNRDGRITWDEFEASLKPAAKIQDAAPSAKAKPLLDTVEPRFAAAENVVEEKEASESVKCLCSIF